MPTYEYECSRCSHTFEVVQSFSDKPKSRCPVCRGKVHRVLHPVGIIFKGSGWYATDSRTDSEKAKFNGDGEAESKPGGKPVTAKSDQKSNGAADKKKSAPKQAAAPKDSASDSDPD